MLHWDSDNDTATSAWASEEDAFKQACTDIVDAINCFWDMNDAITLRTAKLIDDSVRFLREFFPDD